jgi:hypothetical protein
VTRSIRNEALAITVMANVGVLAAIATGIDPTVRLILTLPLVVFVPGYALVRAVAPAAPLHPVVAFPLGLGTSMCLAVLGGLFLQVTPAGMTTTSWAGLLFLISMVSVIVLVWRSRHLHVHSQAHPPYLVETIRSVDRRTLAIYGTFFAVSALIVVSAFGVAIVAFDAQPRPGFTQLWVQPSPPPTTAIIGIENREGHTINVALVVSVGSTVEEEWPSITIVDGGSWQESVTVAGFDSGDQPLVATLTLAEAPDVVYRQVTLWPSTRTPN